jgi:hypothetical protein
VGEKCEPGTELRRRGADISLDPLIGLGNAGEMPDDGVAGAGREDEGRWEALRLERWRWAAEEKRLARVLTRVLKGGHSIFKMSSGWIGRGELS